MLGERGVTIGIRVGQSIRPSSWVVSVVWQLNIVIVFSYYCSLRSEQRTEVRELHGLFLGGNSWIGTVIPHFLTACFLFTRHLNLFYRVIFSNFYIFISRYFINLFVGILHIYISAFYLYALQTFYSSFLKFLSI